MFIVRYMTMIMHLQVDAFLSSMADLTKMEEQEPLLSAIVRHCTVQDLRYIMRLIKHDLR